MDEIRKGKNMTLKEKLNELDGSQLVKIGANGGTAFFYCGDVKSFVDYIDAYDDLMKQATADGAERTEKAFAKASSEFEARKVFGLFTPKKKSKDVFADFTEWTQETILNSTNNIHEAYEIWLADLQKKATAAIGARKLMIEGKSLLEREVIEAFEALSVIEPNPTINIIIYGWEVGKYWMMDEVGKDGKSE